MLDFLRNSILKQYAVVIVVNLSVLLSGMGLAWPSPVLVKLMSETETVLSRPITEEEGSWIVSIGPFVGTFSVVIPILLVDRIGRKRCILLAAAPKLAVGLLLTLASDVWMLLLGRLICGVCDLLVFTVVPMYAAEIASTTVRGSLGTIPQLMCSLGMVIMLSIGPYTSYVTLNTIYTCVAVITFAPLLFLPESPYHLYSKERNEEAIKLLIHLRGSEALAKEEIKEYALSQTDEKISKKALFKNRTFLKALGISIVLLMGTQLIGFNAVSFYLQTVLKSTQTSVAEETASVVIGCIQLSATFVTALITDRFGRKPILSITLIGMTFGMVGLGAFFKIQEKDHPISGFLNYLPLISLILVVFCYNAGIGSLIYAISAELFDGPTRVYGVCISTIMSVLFMFLTSKYFAMVSTTLGPPTTYWFFSVNCVLLCIFILFCFPETKGKTFLEIQEELGAKRSRSKDGIEKNGTSVNDIA
ncbi:facilitated trehalose transporter Tret1-like [Ostrinia furnacalis]|uniref:facilitated trehalose transporter Tret1-like n=1 Tax=Ostrinia furnacalis TaxID=93504 RepID=UPI00103BD4E6|nr:facilitated trehalose transporter Tret1-like [Ostrinia furnacalis]